MLLVSNNIWSNDTLAAAIAGPGGGIGNYLLLTNTIQQGFISLRVNGLPADNENNYWCGIGSNILTFTSGTGAIDTHLFGCYNLYKL